MMLLKTAVAMILLFFLLTCSCSTSPFVVSGGNKTLPPDNSFSFRAYGTVEGVASATKSVLEELPSDRVSYVRLSDGYRYYYRGEDCRRNLNCTEFTVTIRQANEPTSSNVSVTPVAGSPPDMMKEYYLRLGRYIKLSQVMPNSAGHYLNYLNGNFTEVKFRVSSTAGEVAGWIKIILEEMGYKGQGIKYSKLGNNFYRVQFTDYDCEDRRSKWESITSFLGLRKQSCISFIIDVGQRGDSSVVEIYTYEKGLSISIARQIHQRLSDIVKTYDYDES